MSFEINKKIHLIKKLCENQSAIDRYFSSGLNKGEDFIYLIRPQKIYHLYKKYGNKFLFVYKVINYTWPVLFFLYNLFSLLNSVKYCFRKNKNISLTNGVIFKYINIDTKNYSRCFSGYAELSNINNGKEVDVKNIFTIKGVIISFFESLYIFYVLKKNKLLSDYLQTYVIFDTLVHYNHLKKLTPILKNKNIVIFNHYDRWAYVFEYLFKNITIFQHGLISEDLRLPNKLHNIRNVYIYDKKYEKIFRGYISSKNTSFKLYDNDIELVSSDYYDESKINILIINQYSTIYNDEVILNELLRNNKVNIFLKPHPKVKDGYFGKYGENIHIIDQFIFVDLAITFNSTLGDQYETKGVDVYHYEVKNGILNLEHLNHNVESYIKLKRHKNAKKS